MKMYYDRLLRLQGNYYDAGFTSEKEFAEAQRLYWAGEMLGAAGGAAIGQAGRLAGKVGDGIVKLHTPSNAINVPNNNQTGAVGNLSNIDKIGDYVLPTGRQSLDPTRTSFSQATVSYQKTGKPYNYDTIVADMKAKNGWIGDPVDVVNMPDRAPTSMDNTRVLAAREAGVKVEANVHNHSDPLTPSEAQRFKYNGATPTNWGEAIKLRIKKQSQEGFAPKDWSERFSNGSIYDPEVTK